MDFLIIYSLFQDYVCNTCHDLTILSVNISDIVIITAKNVDHHCIIHNIRTSEAINLLENSVLEDRGYLLKIFVLIFSQVFYYFCFVWYK